MKIKSSNNWAEVLDLARSTANKEELGKEPTSKWKIRILMAEHSPIRALTFTWTWEGIKYWASQHLTRHKFGIEHFVSTQRSDRTGVNRDELPQSALVNHSCTANAQAIINISKVRLCKKASPETRQAWKDMLFNLKDIEPELTELCVPMCVSKGFCTEFESCGYDKSEAYKLSRAFYKTAHRRV